MTSIEVIFTPRGRESISWDVYPGDLDVQRTLKSLTARYPKYSWDSRFTSAAPTVTYRGAYFRAANEKY